MTVFIYLIMKASHTASVVSLTQCPTKYSHIVLKLCIIDVAVKKLVKNTLESIPNFPIPTREEEDMK